MSTPDMDVIKEIPGYKVILKAVLKSQIQQLVETLAQHTDEESVILTASVSDGTLSHLGSDSGKSFLEDHDDVKSQFLGFCLKRHHRQKQAEKEKQEAALRTPTVVPPPMGGMGPGFTPRMGFNSGRAPRMNVATRHASPRHSMPSVRHEPYPVSRPQKRNNSVDSAEPGPSHMGPVPGVSSPSVKQEPMDSGAGGMDSSVPSSSRVMSDSGDANVDQKLGFSAASDLNEETTQDSNLSSDATLPNTPGNDTNRSETDFDPNMSVKLETMAEDEGLQITGVEPGRSTSSASNENWVPDASMLYDSTVAGGNQADLTPGNQDYSETYLDNVTGRRWHPCPMCGKMFTRRQNMRRHMRLHTGDKPFSCSVCDRRFNSLWNMKCHYNKHFGLPGPGSSSSTATTGTGMLDASILAAMSAAIMPEAVALMSAAAMPETETSMPETETSKTETETDKPEKETSDTEEKSD